MLDILRSQNGHARGDVLHSESFDCPPPFFELRGGHCRHHLFPLTFPECRLKYSEGRLAHTEDFGGASQTRLINKKVADSAVPFHLIELLLAVVLALGELEESLLRRLYISFGF